MIHHPVQISEEIKTLNVISDAFEDGGHIPLKYTSDGENINPPLSIKNIPLEAKSLALIVEDPDAPIRPWIHWLVWNIPVSGKIDEDSIPGTEGWNSFSKIHYGGPCPPSRTHRYTFKVYALDELLNLHVASNKVEMEKAMSKHIIAFGELTGLYKKAEY